VPLRKGGRAGETERERREGGKAWERKRRKEAKLDPYH